MSWVLIKRLAFQRSVGRLKRSTDRLLSLLCLSWPIFSFTISLGCELLQLAKQITFIHFVDWQHNCRRLGQVMARFRVILSSIVHVNSTVAVTWNWIFLDFIFPMQVSFGNEKNFVKRVKRVTLTALLTWTIYTLLRYLSFIR